MPPSELTRRDFLAASAVAAGAAALPRFAAANWAHAAGSDTMKVGLVGCGARGTGAALQAISADQGTLLYAMADVFPDRIDACLSNIQQEVATRVQEGGGGADASLVDRIQVDPSRRFTGFDGFQSLIAECDVIVLATPPHFRPAHLRAAVEAGKHVFCEKPVAVDGPGVRHVLQSAEMARSRNQALVCGYCWRYSARERETYQRIHDGAIGAIRAVYTNYLSGGFPAPRQRRPEWSDVEYQARNWHYYTWLSGDHMVEQATHSIDKLAWAMNGELPTRCSAVGGRQVRPNTPEFGNIFDHFAVTYEFASGARGFHTCRHWPACPTDNSDYIMGARGTCTVNGWTDTHVITGENAWTCSSPKNDMYQEEHNQLFASIRAGTPINDGVWMSHSTLMSVMARMAAYTGAVVAWDEALNSQEKLGPNDYGPEPYVWPPVAVPGQTKFF